MSREFQLPDPGEGIQEAEIVEVLVAAGDAVEESDVLLNVETDKAVVEVPAPFTGTVEEIRVAVGDRVEVGETVLTWTPDGEEEADDKEADDREATGEKGAEATAADTETADEDADTETAEGDAGGEEEAAEEEATDSESRESTSPDTPVPASPSTRRRARELGVALDAVEGSGPEGRVTRADVEAAAEEGAEPAKEEDAEAEAAPEKEEGGAEAEAAAEDEELEAERTAEPAEAPGAIPERERIPLRSVRRTIARRMAESWRTIPHVTHFDHADITVLESFRRKHANAVEEEGGKLTLSVFLLKAAVAALREFPRFNARLDEEAEEVVLLDRYHVGVAVDTERGLLVPVVRDVDRKSLSGLARELGQLAEGAREQSLSREQLSGGTFTFTNPGPIGGDRFTPIINPPQVAILGAGQASYQAVVSGPPEDADQAPRVEARLILPLSLSFDHRVNDGADAARFVRRIVEVLEDPADLVRHL